jgi:putative flavoprotein involved in K+ transport
MNNSILDVIVVGAGHAGLCISYYLTKHEFRHIVFEQGRIGETWRSQRWDSFKMNSANKLNLLPEQQAYFNDTDAFAFANEFAMSLENYTKQLKLSVREYCKVLEVKKNKEQNIFVVTVSEDNKERTYLSRQLVIASGGQNGILIPAFAKNISQSILQLHTSEYKNPGQLPNGNVLVVGSAQSGTQIAEDLVRANKTVFLSSGKVGRIPRRYRGRDIFDWLFELGFYDVFTDDVTDPSLLKIKNPQVSGAGERGKTSSLQSLARSGVMILGRVENADLDNIFLQSNAPSHIRYADEFSLGIKKLIDNYIKKNNLFAPLPEDDPDDIPDENASCASHTTKLNLEDNNIKSIIWTTGFSGDFNYIKLPVLTEEKMPKHRNGISEVTGLYFIGLPWLRKRKSALIPGISDDAEFIVNQILETALH